MSDQPSTRYLKFSTGYARAVWVKSRRLYRLRYLWTDVEHHKVEELASPTYKTHEEVSKMRRLKNKPSFKMVREQELAYAKRLRIKNTGEMLQAC